METITFGLFDLDNDNKINPTKPKAKMSGLQPTSHTGQVYTPRANIMTLN